MKKVKVTIITILIILVSVLSVNADFHYTGTYNFRWRDIHDLNMWSYMFYDNNNSSSVNLDYFSTRITNYHTNAIPYTQVQVYEGTSRRHFDYMVLDEYGMEIKQGETASIRWNINKTVSKSPAVFVYDSTGPSGADSYLVGWETIFYTNSIVSTKHE